MTSPETMNRILEYFGGNGKYNNEVVTEMTKIVDRLGENDRDRIYARLIEEERSAYHIGVKEIVSACQFLGIGYHVQQRFGSEEWSCDACDRQFRYQMCTDDEDHFNGIFDKCPRCGFQPTWTKTILGYAQIGMISQRYKDRYQALKIRAAEKYAAGNLPFFSERLDRESLERQRKAQAEAQAEISKLTTLKRPFISKSQI